jgi:hypothetical protein
MTFHHVPKLSGNGGEEKDQRRAVRTQQETAGVEYAAKRYAQSVGKEYQLLEFGGSEKRSR